MVEGNRPALAVDAQDIGRPLEGAPHQGDAAVLRDMGQGLNAGTAEIEIGQGVIIDNGDAVIALG